MNSAGAKVLPDFNDNPSNAKNGPLTQEIADQFHCNPMVLPVLEAIARRLHKTPQQLRVLDYGCGRGETVAYLRRRGYDCYGVEIGPLFVRNAQAYFGAEPAPFAAVSLLSDGRSPFPDGFFDVVLSDQVFEHVSDIEMVAAELSRIMSNEGTGFHIFPSAFSLVEPHMYLPVCHWLPKNNARFRLIHFMLALGMGAPYFKDFSTADRARVFYQFSVSDTHYRTTRELSAVLNRHGMVSREIVREKFLHRGGALTRIATVPLAGPLAVWIYGTFYQTYLLTARNPAALAIGL